MRKKQLTPRFLEVPHTADEAIDVFGFSLEEMFTNAVLGMLSIMEIRIHEEGGRWESLFLAENDYESLLVEFLGEILYMVEQNRYPSNIHVKISGFQLVTSFQPSLIVFSGKEIKAITFNQLNVVHENDRFKTRIIFDI